MNMKKITGLLALMLTAAIAVNAQSDANAVKLLKSVSNKYAAYSTMAMDVSIVIDNPESSSDETLSGSAMMKGDKFSLEFGDQHIICDGKVMWVYLKDVNEVQISYFNPQDEMFTPDRIFKLAEKDFLVLAGNAYDKGGSTIKVIELIPHDKSQSYSEIKLHINSSTNTIDKAVIFEKSGIRYNFSISNFAANKSISDSRFVFSKEDHPGVVAIDLRE
jgi:outer membrane lipoprotein carrier protein